MKNNIVAIMAVLLLSSCITSRISNNDPYYYAHKLPVNMTLSEVIEFYKIKPFYKNDERTMLWIQSLVASQKNVSPGVLNNNNKGNFFLFNDGMSLILGWSKMYNQWIFLYKNKMETSRLFFYKGVFVFTNL